MNMRTTLLTLSTLFSFCAGSVALAQEEGLFAKPEEDAASREVIAEPLLAPEPAPIVKDHPMEEGVVVAEIVEEREPEGETTEETVSKADSEDGTEDALFVDEIESEEPATEPATTNQVEVVTSDSPTGDPNEKQISVTFDEAPLIDVIKTFRDATGANIIFNASTNMSQFQVSVHLNSVPWRKGLRAILSNYNLTLSEQEENSGIYTIEETKVIIPKFTRTFKLNHAKVSEVQVLFQDMLGITSAKANAKAGVKTGGVANSVTTFPSANVVVVTASEKELSECERVIKAIDLAVAQVYIEARFVQVDASASKQVGMKWDSLTGWGVTAKNINGGVEVFRGRTANYGVGTASGTGEPVAWGESAGNMTPWRNAAGASGQLSASDFSLILSAFEQMDGVTVFSNPKVIVSNEKTAKVDMTTKYPNVNVTATRSGDSGQQLDISAKIEAIPGEDKLLFAKEAFFSWGIALDVTPRVSPDGLITVQIVPSISDREGYYSVTSSKDAAYSQYPIINVKRIDTTFTMKDGTTAVIGGLSRTSEDMVDNGIPLLRDIPWVGPRLFGWKSREKKQSEIIIFVTVGIANPENIPQDIGMPKNAIYTKGLLTGEMKEPGDRKRQDVMSVEDPETTK